MTALEAIRAEAEPLAIEREAARRVAETAQEYADTLWRKFYTVDIRYQKLGRAEAALSEEKQS